MNDSTREDFPLFWGRRLLRPDMSWETSLSPSTSRSCCRSRCLSPGQELQQCQPCAKGAGNSAGAAKIPKTALTPQRWAGGAQYSREPGV